MAGTKLEVVDGDITRLKVDAVVNAANKKLAGGGGVDGAIHRAAGKEKLQKACRQIGGCPTGEVRVTEGFDLPAKYIFHAVGPVWRDGAHGEDQQLAACYRNAIREAGERDVASIAFPAISCGVYGFPMERAVDIAVSTVGDAVKSASGIEKVVFCCFDAEMAECYRDALADRGD
jgi:O-acetyl-ADP-ribose deacetylase (regulator of RNase III)